MIRVEVTGSSLEAEVVHALAAIVGQFVEVDVTCSSGSAYFEFREHDLIVDGLKSILGQPIDTPKADKLDTIIELLRERLPVAVKPLVEVVNAYGENVAPESLAAFRSLAHDLASAATADRIASNRGRATILLDTYRAFTDPRSPAFVRDGLAVARSLIDATSIGRTIALAKAYLENHK